MLGSMPPKRKSTSCSSDTDDESKPYRGAVKGTDDYRKKREKNNIAVKKSREKSRQKARETIDRVNRLKSENADLEQKVTLLSKELSLLKDLFLTHASSGDVCTVTRRHCTVSESSISSVEEEDRCDSEPPGSHEEDFMEETQPERLTTSKSRRGKNNKRSPYCKDGAGLYTVNTEALQKDHVYCCSGTTIMSAS